MQETIGLVVGVVGAVVAISALVADLLGRQEKWKAVKEAITRLGAKVKIRKDASEKDNLRQFLVLLGASFLLVSSLCNAPPVYIALQVLLAASALLWYFDLSEDREWSERVKGWSRLVLALLVWAVLEYFELCPEFHRLGVVGLELLGCAFVIQRAVKTRDVLCLLGGLMLATYAGVGVFFDPQHVSSHSIWFGLNAVYSGVGGVLLGLSFRKPKEDVQLA